MPRKLWTKQLYDTLHLHLFHHIAHFNQAGFYAEWFETPGAGFAGSSTFWTTITQKISEFS
jgi:hypothetical protein